MNKDKSIVSKNRPSSGINLTQTIASIHKKVTSVRLFTLISDRKKREAYGGGKQILDSGIELDIKGDKHIVFCELKR
jgi:hypothetical protein